MGKGIPEGNCALCEKKNARRELWEKGGVEGTVGKGMLGRGLWERDVGGEGVGG